MMKEKKVNGKPERKEKLLESILHCSGDDNGGGGGELERVKFKGKTRHTMYYHCCLAAIESTRRSVPGLYVMRGKRARARMKGMN